MPSGQRLIARIGTTAGGETAEYEFAPQLAFVFTTGNDRLAATEVTRIYADPGSTVVVTVFRSANSDFVIGDVALSGHLVDVP